MLLSRVPTPVWEFREVAPFIPSHGWIRDYVAYAIQCTDAPPMYHVLSAIGGTCIAVSPDHVVSIHGEEHPIHMFLLAIGESGNRKSAAIKRCLKLITPRLQVQGLQHRVWYPEASTAEGIFGELQKDPCRLMIASEWTELHNQGKAHYNQHSKEFMNLLYDGAPLHRIKAKEQLVVEKPCVSILGASTPSLVKQCTDLYDWNAGKLARYVIGYQSKPEDREMLSSIEHPKLVLDLQVGYDHLLSPSHTKSFVLSQVAWDYKIHCEQSPDWRHFKRSLPEHLQPSVLRTSEHMYRLAAIYQASMDYPHNTVIGEEAMVKAESFLWWCNQGLLEAFGIMPSHEGNSATRVLQVLTMHGAAGLSRRDLMRETHLSGKQITEAIETLKEREDVAVWPKGNTLHYCHRMR